MSQAVQSDQVAQQIYQDLLDRLGQCLTSGDFETFSRFVSVPNTLATFTKTHRVNTLADLEALFNDFSQHLISSKVTNYERICLAARFVEDDLIIGTHETHILSGSHYLQPKYPVKSYLRREGEVWTVCCSENALEENEGFARSLGRTLRTSKTPAAE